VGVLVTGDFNVSAPDHLDAEPRQELYRHMLSMGGNASCRDLFVGTHDGKHSDMDAPDWAEGCAADGGCSCGGAMDTGCEACGGSSGVGGGSDSRYSFTIHPCSERALEAVQGDKGNSMFPWPRLPCRVDYHLAVDRLWIPAAQVGQGCSSVDVAGNTSALSCCSSSGESVGAGGCVQEGRWVDLGHIAVLWSRVVRQGHGLEWSDHYGVLSSIIMQ